MALTFSGIEANSARVPFSAVPGVAKPAMVFKRANLSSGKASNGKSELAEGVGVGTATVGVAVGRGEGVAEGVAAGVGVADGSVGLADGVTAGIGVADGTAELAEGEGPGVLVTGLTG